MAIHIHTAQGSRAIGSHLPLNVALAIVPTLAGHYAHHHAIMGAMAGCAAGHMYYKHKAHAAAAHK